MITFSWNATLEFSFDEYSNDQSLINAIKGVMANLGPTYLAEALNLAEQVRKYQRNLCFYIVISYPKLTQNLRHLHKKIPDT